MLNECPRCSTRFAVGLTSCPHCRLAWVDDLETLRKPALVTLAKQRGIDHKGTKAELIDRLR